MRVVLIILGAVMVGLGFAELLQPDLLPNVFFENSTAEAMIFIVAGVVVGGTSSM